MFVNFYNNLKPYGRFATTGFLTGLICTFVWDVDDYGLIMTLMPGWLFGLVFIITLFTKAKLFSLLNIFKALIWIPICGGCFLAAVEITSGGYIDLMNTSIGDDPNVLTPGIAGFVTTLVMVSAFYTLFEGLDIVDIISISIIAAVVSLIGFYFYFLFVLYHFIISLCLGAAVMRKLNSLES